MPEKIPLGQMESERLELKGRDALKEPEKIAREVVAFLNAEGGEIWIGLAEGENGTAEKVEPIEDPNQARIRLRDSLVDTIEPRLSAEVRIEVVVEGEGAVLLISTIPEEGKKPYALLRKGGREFLIRVADRMRPMTREEIFARNAPSEDELDGLVQSLRQELEEERRSASQGSRGFYWFRLKPAKDLELDLDRLEGSNLLIDPSLTGNRRVGRNFVAAFTVGHLRPVRQRHQKRVCLEVGKHEIFWLRIYRDGSLAFTAPLASFHAGVQPGAEKPLWPEALAEYPVSLLRLAGALYGEESLWEGDKLPSPQLEVGAHLAIFGLGGWSLRPGTPRLPLWFQFLREEPKIYQEEDFILERPLIFKAKEIRDEPDRCGYRLVRRFYEEAFLFSEDDLPDYFDCKTGRLVLPE
jgi:hypothetical protein